MIFKSLFLTFIISLLRAGFDYSKYDFIFQNCKPIQNKKDLGIQKDSPMRKFKGFTLYAVPNGELDQNDLIYKFEVEENYEQLENFQKIHQIDGKVPIQNNFGMINDCFYISDVTMFKRKKYVKVAYYKTFGRFGDEMVKDRSLDKMDFAKMNFKEKMDVWRKVSSFFMLNLKKKFKYQRFSLKDMYLDQNSYIRVPLPLVTLFYSNAYLRYYQTYLDFPEEYVLQQ